MNRTLRSTYETNKSGRISAIAQLLRANIKTGDVQVFVEGPDDDILYSKIFKKVYAVKSCSRYKEILDNVYLKQLGRISQFILIKDADFDNLNNITYPYSNMFLTDRHDLETFLIKEETSSKFLEMLNISSIKYDIFLKAMLDIKPLSLIKWFNLYNRNSLDSRSEGISFNNIKFNNLYPLTSVNIDYWFDQISLKSEQKEKIQLFYNEKKDENDLLNLTNGHDLVKVLLWKLKDIGFKKNCSRKNILNYLLDNFKIEDFKCTNLYDSIILWLKNQNKSPEMLFR